MKYSITFRGIKLEVEQLPNGKFKKPDLGLFTKQGLGSVWLDEGRIPYENSDDIRKVESRQINKNKGHTRFNPLHNQNAIWNPNPISPEGRFPANLLCSDDVLNDGKVSKSGKDAIRRQEGMFIEHHLGGIGNPQVYHPDSGSFSRYFSLDAWWEKRLKDLPESVRRTFPFLICPKSAKSEKNKGLENIYTLKDNAPEKDINEIKRILDIN